MSNTQQPQVADEDLLDANEVGEVIEDTGDDIPMEDDDGEDYDDGEEHEIQLENDATGYFDCHNGPIFTIGSHPHDSTLHITGGGDDTGFIFRSSAPPASDPDSSVRPYACKPIQQLPSHKDSITTACFLPSGNVALTAGLDGAIHIFAAPQQGIASNGEWKMLHRIQEVEEISWLVPHPSNDAFALGANDGSVWIYDCPPPTSGPPVIRHVFHSFTSPTPAGCWAPNGNMLAATSEDGELTVWDAASGSVITTHNNSDARFAVEGGLFSVGISPSSAAVVAGGGEGEIRVIALRGEATGRIVAAAKPHNESVESIAFHPSAPIVATGSVDGTVAIIDPAKAWAIRGSLEGHGDAVVAVKWTGQEWGLVSCGVDGTVRGWDAREGKEVAVWRGHLGGNKDEGEGGVLGFVIDQQNGRVITAGDDGVALVFDIGTAGGQAGAPTIAAPRH